MADENKQQQQQQQAPFSTTTATTANTIIVSEDSYYQGTILNITRSLKDCHSNILNEHELGLLSAIEALPLNPQRLFFRLYCKKNEWQRAKKLCYWDIDDISTALDYLIDSPVALCEEFKASRAEDLLTLLTIEELKGVMKFFNLKPVNGGSDGRRKGLIKAVLNLARNKSKQMRLSFGARDTASSSTGTSTSTSGGGTLSCESVDYDKRIPEVIVQQCGKFIRLKTDTRATFDRLLGLFFLDDPLSSSSSSRSNGANSSYHNNSSSTGTIQQQLQAKQQTNLTVAILAGLGRSQYPQYKIIRTRPVFPCRGDWLAFEAAATFRTIVELSVEANKYTEEELIAWRDACIGTLGPSRPVVISLDLDDSSSENDNDGSDGDGDGGSGSGGKIHDRSSSRNATTPLFFLRYTAEAVTMRTLAIIATGMEREKMHEAANDIFWSLLQRETLCCRSNRGKWWQRYILNMCHHLKEPKNRAISLCSAALKDPYVRMGQRLWLETRLTKLQGQQQQELQKEVVLETSRSVALESPPFGDFDLVPAATGSTARVIEESKNSRINSVQKEKEKVPVYYIYADALKDVSSGSKLVFEHPETHENCSVEDLALSHFLQGTVSGREDMRWNGGFHCESGVLTTLFVLSFWDIIFSDMPDVFQTPFQTAPLDLYTDAFYSDGRRTAAIQQRLVEIGAGKCAELVEAAHKAHFEELAAGVSWTAYPLSALLDISKAMGGGVLSIMFSLFAQDFRHTCSGIPDLLVYFSPNQEKKIDAATASATAIDSSSSKSSSSSSSSSKTSESDQIKIANQIQHSNIAAKRRRKIAPPITVSVRRRSPFDGGVKTTGDVQTTGTTASNTAAAAAAVIVNNSAVECLCIDLVSDSDEDQQSSESKAKQYANLAAEKNNSHCLSDESEDLEEKQDDEEDASYITATLEGGKEGGDEVQEEEEEEEKEEDEEEDKKEGEERIVECGGGGERGEEDRGGSARGQYRYMMIEVKSVNDQLSDAQKNWNALFLQNGINVAMCRVLPEATQQQQQHKKRRKS